MKDKASDQQDSLPRKNPYQSMGKDKFWKTGVETKTVDAVFDALWTPKFPISRGSKIITAGSCFAQHISNWLKANGYQWIESESAPDGSTEQSTKEYGYGVFSFRTGNIYTAALLRQWIALAIYPEYEIDEIFVENGRFFDPLRPTIPANGYASAAELKAARRKTLDAILNTIKAADVFIFTLGLTETWMNKKGYVYPSCPGTIRGVFDEQEHVFINYSYDHILEDMVWIIDQTKRINPGIKFLLTVSPVPLTATATHDHVLTATTYSKAVLRSVAGMLANEAQDVDYFPSYELIGSPASRGRFYQDNLRTIKTEGVDFVMEHFARAIGERNTSTTAPPPSTATREDEVCEDILLESWNQNSEIPPDVAVCLLGDSHMGKLSQAFNETGIRHHGGMIMNGSAWVANLLHLDDAEIMVPLEDSGSRTRWQKTLKFFEPLPERRERIVVTNIGMQTHLSVHFLLEHLARNNIGDLNPATFRDCFEKQNEIKIKLLKAILARGIKVLVISDPPTHTMNGEIVKSRAFWDFYDEHALKLLREHGCLTFDARAFFSGDRFKDAYYSETVYSDGQKDWVHGSAEYYRALTSALVEKYNLAGRAIKA